MGRQKTYLPVRSDEREEGGNCLEKLLTKALYPVVSRGHPNQYRTTGYPWRGGLGLKYGCSASRAEVKLKNMLCFFSEDELNVTHP